MFETLSGIDECRVIPRRDLTGGLVCTSSDIPNYTLGLSKTLLGREKSRPEGSLITSESYTL